MRRREFLAAATAASALSIGRTVRAQKSRQADPEKLARIAVMTLDFNAILKLPTQPASPTRTLEILDVPEMLADMYGVHNVEFQHQHLAQDAKNPDPAFFKELKAKFDAVGSRANQINIEIGTLAQLGPDGKASALSGDARATWLETGKKWADVAPLLGIKRLMLNQGALTDDSKEGVTSLWKELQDYATPKGILISAETRGTGVPTAGGRGAAGQAAAAPPPPAPAMPEQERLRYVWGILNDCIEKSGGYSNLDFGGAGRFANQQQLHDAIKGMMKRSAGNMHVKSSPDWDIGKAVSFAESIGYKGLYTIEVNPDPAIRIVYNTILANIA